MKNYRNATVSVFTSHACSALQVSYADVAPLATSSPRAFIPHAVTDGVSISVRSGSRESRGQTAAGRTLSCRAVG